MESVGPRWKRRDFAGIATANPMSEIVKHLQTSLTQSETRALLSGCDVLLEVGSYLADLLDRACFGRPIATAEKDTQWFRLGMEEAFYMCHALKCLIILGEDGSPMNGEQLWEYMESKNPTTSTFPGLYKAYSHLRAKNWVVRSGTQYGVDFVAYRHHPALVHSEYAVLVLPEGDGNGSCHRLKVWSDLQCTLRVSGSVAKTLLVLSIKSNNGDNAIFPSCLEQCSVEERVIGRWVPEQCRDDDGSNKNVI